MIHKVQWLSTKNDWHKNISVHAAISFSVFLKHVKDTHLFLCILVLQLFHNSIVKQDKSFLLHFARLWFENPKSAWQRLLVSFSAIFLNISSLVAFLMSSAKALSSVVTYSTCNWVSALFCHQWSVFEAGFFCYFSEFLHNFSNHCPVQGDPRILGHLTTLLANTWKLQRKRGYSSIETFATSTFTRLFICISLSDHLDRHQFFAF